MFSMQTLLWPGLSCCRALRSPSHAGGGRELRTSPGGNPRSALKHQLSNALALNSLFILSFETGLSWGQWACLGPRAVTKAPQPH